MASYVLVFSHSVMYTLCDPLGGSPPGSSVHGDSQGKNTRVDWHFLLQGFFPTRGLNLGLLDCRMDVFTVWATWVVSLRECPMCTLEGCVAL